MFNNNEFLQEYPTNIIQYEVFDTNSDYESKQLTFGIAQNIIKK